MEEILTELQKLPGIGPEGSRRIMFYLMGKSQKDLQRLADTIISVGKIFRLCEDCGNITRYEKCEICENILRDHKTLCIVEDIRSLLCIEDTGTYDGVYQVMQPWRKAFSDSEPSQQECDKLTARINELQPSEIIIATSPNITGQLTFFAAKDAIKAATHKPEKITRLAFGLPAGVHVEHAATTSIQAALDFRTPVDLDEPKSELLEKDFEELEKLEKLNEAF